MQNTVPLNSNQYTNVWNLYRTHPTVGCCIQTIRQCVFGGGLTINGAHKQLIDHFNRIGRSALDWILCIGLVPVILKRNDAGQMLPWLPEPETVDLFVNIDSSGQRSFSASLKGINGSMNGGINGRNICLEPCTAFNRGSQHVQNCMVWSGCDFLPTVKGELITPITHLEVTERFLHILRQNALVASVLQSNPPLVTKSVTKQNGDNDGVMWNVDDATVQEADYQKLKMTAENTRAEFNLHKDNWGTGGGIPTKHEEFYNFSERCKPHEYFLSAERDLVQPQQPTVPSNLVEMTRMCDEKICQIFGVPAGMFGNHDAKVQSHYMQVFSLNGNMKLAKKQVESFLQEIWTICKLTHNEHDTTHNEHGEQKTRENTHNEHDTTLKRQKTRHETETDNTYDVHLLGVPCMQQDDVMKMVNYGYLTDQEACNAMRTMVGMPMLDDATVAKQVEHRLQQNAQHGPRAQHSAAHTTPQHGPPAHREHI
jgi:hypothetical protein